MSFRPKQEPPKCARCTAPAQCEVWERPLCLPCHALWHADARFELGAINAACGIDSRAVSQPGDLERQCAEWKRRTAAWVAEAKRRAA